VNPLGLRGFDHIEFYVDNATSGATSSFRNTA